MKDQEKLNHDALLLQQISERRNEFLENMYTERDHLFEEDCEGKSKAYTYLKKLQMLSALYEETQKDSIEKVGLLTNASRIHLRAERLKAEKKDDCHDLPVLVQLVKWLEIIQTDTNPTNIEEIAKLTTEIEILKNIIVRVNSYISSQEFFPKEIDRITALVDYDISRKSAKL